MGLPAKTKEQLEKEILETLAEYHKSCGDSMESRRQAIFARLTERVFKWCCDYPFKFFRDKKIEPEEKGLEIYKAVEKCVTTPSAPKEGKGFLSYLVTTIENAIIKHSTETDYCEDTIRITRGRLNKQNKIDWIIRPHSTKQSDNIRPLVPETSDR
ncbi:hypothetical protein FACS1894137_17910 [Spirochaetia bacterium]|nr:hypothetical protein FACS1894137_17910 [Spirochaetia bacterium]